MNVNPEAEEEKRGHSDYRLFRNDWQAESDKVNWCPLYGELPESLSGYPAKTQAAKCFEIIQAARDILKVFRNRGERDLYNNRESNLDFYQVFRFGKCPDPDEVPFYPKKKLKAIRQLFDKWDSQVLPHIERMRKKPYEVFKGIPVYLSEEIYHWPPDALKACIYGTIGIDNLKHYEILALLAIRSAWDSLEEMFIFDMPEDEVLMRSVQQAGFLLATATDDKKEETIKRIKPLADERKRQKLINRNKATRTNRLKKQKQKERIEVLKKEVCAITKQNKTLTIEGIINRVVRRRKVNYTSRHLRRLMKNPANNILPKA